MFGPEEYPEGNSAPEALIIRRKLAVVMPVDLGAAPDGEAAPQRGSPRRPHPRGWIVAALGLPIVMLMTALLVYQASLSAFSPMRSGRPGALPGNAVLSSRRLDGALQGMENLVGGARGNQDVEISYAGSRDVIVKMYATEPAHAAAGEGARSIDEFLVLRITSPDGHFLYGGTLARFRERYVDWSSGVGHFAMKAGDAPVSYNIAWVVDPEVPQDVSGSLAFSWEAQEIAVAP